MISRALYIHIPWCIKKCPYCDFNSHKSPDMIPEAEYIDALIKDFEADFERYPAEKISSIFIGGGTPSLLEPSSYQRLLKAIQKTVSFEKEIEITLEANPGTMEVNRFKGYREVGINRLSIGVQSFNDQHLKVLGRIHDAKQALQAIQVAKEVGFTNINLDLMYGLPKQTLEEGLEDLNKALALEPQHLSWYQLTLEQNTVFYKRPPKLPDEDALSELEAQGLELLRKGNYERYEISAFCKAGRVSQHNLNYWLFGDYYGIGAGAHGKLTQPNNQVERTRKVTLPKRYLDNSRAPLAETQVVNPASRFFEFMLNSTRLEQSIPFELTCIRTGLTLEEVKQKLELANQKGLIHLSSACWKVTDLGRRFTNDLQALFLPIY